MIRSRLAASLSGAALLLVRIAPLLAEDPALHLAIGDPARKDRKAPLVWDAITDTRTGDLLSPAELVQRLAGTRLVLVGESHTDINFHRAQLSIVEELHGAGREVLLGLEMFPYTQQEFLSRWSSGEYSDEEFLEAADWYESWGYHWDYYRDIFVFARDNELPMYGLNLPREVVSAVRMKGFDELTDEQRGHMPPTVDTDNREHFQLFQAFFEEEDEFHAQLSDEQWQGMFNAQCTWDATFGYEALKVLEKHPDPQAVLVVLVGSGHAAYDLGIQRQVRQWSAVPIATVMPISIREWDELEPITEVQASYADFLWGMPPAADPIYPVLGVSTTTRNKEHLTVIYVSPDSVGERTGFELGDELLAFDGQELIDQAMLRRLMAGKTWSDKATIRIRRGDEIRDLHVALRRQLPEIDDTEERDAEDGERQDEADPQVLKEATS